MDTQGKKSYLILSWILLAFVFAGVLSISVYSSIIVFTHSYSSFVEWFLKLTGKPQLNGVVQQIFPEGKFRVLHYALPVFLVAWLFTGWWAWKKRKRIIAFMALAVEKVAGLSGALLRTTAPGNSRLERLFWFLFVVFTLRNIIDIAWYPVSFDEADTWLLFVRHGPVVITTFYPFPNNHILYNLVAWPFTFLPIDQAIALRLPLIPAFITSFFLFSRLAGRLMAPVPALVALAVFSFSMPVHLFSLYARGYLFVLVFALASTIAFLHILNGTAKRRHWWLLFFCSVAGMYTVPTYIYFLLGTMGFVFFYLLIKRRFSDITKLVRAGILVLCVTSLLYLPVVLVSGTEGFTKYALRAFDWSDLNENFNFSMKWTYEFLVVNNAFALIVCLMLVAAGIACIYRKISNRQRLFILFCVVQVVLPALFFFLLLQPFPERSWIHLEIFFALLAGWAFVAIEKYLRKQWILYLTIIIILAVQSWYSYTNPLIRSDLYYSLIAKKLSHTMINRGDDDVYIRHYYFKPVLEFYMASHHRPLKIYSARANYGNKVGFDPAHPYDAIIWNVTNVHPPLQFSYDTIMKVKEVEVYLLKKE